MAYAAAEISEILGMEEAVPAARNLVAPSVLGALSRRSDLRGTLQFAAHGACMCATGLLVWLAEPFWYLLVPAMALHGVTIVTMFAPMHECVHRTACLASHERDRRLDRRGAELLQLDLLLVFPLLASPLHARSRSRPRADVSEGGQPPRLSVGNQRLYVRSE